MNIFIGSFNLDNKKPGIYGGQIQKNRVIRKYFCDENIPSVFIDTVDFVGKFKAIWRLFLTVFKSDKIIISTSLPSSYYLLMLLSFIDKIKKVEVFYWVIGGSLSKRVGEIYNPKYFSVAKKVFVESEKMRVALTNKIKSEVIYIPNFKDVKIYSAKEMPLNKFNLVYLSQVSKAKGIFDLVELLDNSELNFTLDIYGSVIQEESEAFFNLISDRTYVNYKGFLDLQSEKGYQQLSKYSFLVFPTKHVNEGFPGVLIDSFIAGLPIIASDWNLNSEIVLEGYNGFLFENNNATQFHDILKVISKMSNSEYLKLRNNALNSKYKYNSSACIESCLSEMKIKK